MGAHPSGRPRAGWFVAASLGLAMVSLAACGGASSGTIPAQKGASKQVTTTAAASSSAGGKTSKTSKTLQHVSLDLGWVVSGYHAPYYLAAAKGWYKQAGIAIQLVPGKGSVSTVQQVGHGNYQFGLADASVAARAITKGVPLEVVAGYFQKSPDGLVSLASSHIKKPSDLIGKKVAISPDSSSADLLPAFEAANHIRPSQISVVTMGPENLVAILAEGKVAAVGDFSVDVIPPMALKGVKATELYYADWGAPLLSNSLEVNDAFAKAHPQLVRAFVRVTDRAWAYASTHQAEAIAAEKAAYPHLMPSAGAQLKLSVPLLHTPNTVGKPVGWMSPKDWQTTIRLMQKYEGLTKPLPIGRYYTDQFIGSGTSGS